MIYIYKYIYVYIALGMLDCVYLQNITEEVFKMTVLEILETTFIDMWMFTTLPVLMLIAFGVYETISKKK